MRRLAYIHKKPYVLAMRCTRSLPSVSISRTEPPLIPETSFPLCLHLHPSHQTSFFHQEQPPSLPLKMSDPQATPRLALSHGKRLLSTLTDFLKTVVLKLWAAKLAFLSILLFASFVVHFHLYRKLASIETAISSTIPAVLYHNITQTTGSTSPPPPPPPPGLFAELYGRRLYVFGDSTVDAGNFNATKHPYGLDLEDRTPGRFCNGLTIADLLAKKISTPIPQASKRLGADELKESNVNFACGGCGVLGKTRAMECNSLLEQITQLTLASPKDLERAVYFLSAGANDYMFPFLKENPSPDKFADEVIRALEHSLRVLYNNGARTFIVNNIGPVGCIPDRRHKFLVTDESSTECDQWLNKAIKMYNSKLVKALKNLSEFEDVSVILADSFKLFTDILEDPSEFGFQNAMAPCCGEWIANFDMYQCHRKKNETMLLCDRQVFLFFDGAHTTEKANKIFVDKCFSGDICRAIRK